jgi:hypothetical protein
VPRTQDIKYIGDSALFQNVVGCSVAQEEKFYEKPELVTILRLSL